MSDTPKPVKKHVSAPQPVIVTSATTSKDDSFALASLILGITSVTFMGPITGIPAIILGIVSLKNSTNRGYSIAGIITGAVSVVFTILVIMFIALLIVFSGANYENSTQTDHMDMNDSWEVPAART